MFACNNLHMTDMRAKRKNILKAINKYTNKVNGRLALHYILYIIEYNAHAIAMDNLRLLSSGIRLQRDRATPPVTARWKFCSRC